MRYFFTCYLVLAFLLSASSQQLSDTERKLISVVDKNMAECLSLFEKLVNINSGTFNTEGVRQVGQVLKTEFEKIGLQTSWIEMPAAMRRAGHLLVKSNGSKGKRVLLIGHLDTVFEPDHTFQTFKRDNSTATGPGVNDMKSGDLVILYALRSLAEAKVLQDANVMVLLHGDEENPGLPISISRQHLINAAKNSDYALGFENATSFNVATIARRGSSSWEVKVKGKQAHSASVFSKETGVGAIYEASRILNSFYQELRAPYLTFNAGIIAGGGDITNDSAAGRMQVYGKTNIIPQSAVIKGDLRFISNKQLIETRQRMTKIVKANLPGTSAQITFRDGYPSMPPTAGNKRLLQYYSNVSIDLGSSSVDAYDPSGRGAGDISFISQYVDCLDGLGAIGTGAHSPAEKMDLSTFDDQIKRAAILIYRLTR